jgi:hypothetical protein
MGPMAFLPLRRKLYYGFYHPQNPSSSAGFEPTYRGSSGKHANHYTTKGDRNSFIHNVNTKQTVKEDVHIPNADLIRYQKRVYYQPLKV